MEQFGNFPQDERPRQKKLSITLLVIGALVLLYVIHQFVTSNNLMNSEEAVVGLDKKAQNSLSTLVNGAKSEVPVLKDYGDRFEKIALANASVRGDLGSFVTMLHEDNLALDPGQWSRLSAFLEARWAKFEGDLNAVVGVCVEIRQIRRKPWNKPALWMASTDEPFDVDQYLNIPIAKEARETWESGEVEPLDLTDALGGNQGEAEAEE